jgi:drug/metabolite transporter (DMT)-like permease
MKPKALSLIQVNGAVVLWGLTVMFPKLIDMSPYGIVAFRSVVAAASIAIFMKFTGGSLAIQRRKDYWLMGVLGVILAVHWVTLFTALQMAEAAVVVIALNTYPALTALLEPLASRKLPKLMDTVLAVIVFACVLLLLPGTGAMLTLGPITLTLPRLAFDNQTSIAIALAVTSGALFATRNIIIHKYAKAYSGSTLMFYQTVITAVLLVAFIPRSAAPYTPQAIGMLVLLGVIFTALPQSLYAAGLRHLSAKTVGILSLMQVLYAGFWGYMLKGETITTRTAIGGSIILTCIIFETLRNTQAKPPVSLPTDEMEI